MRYFLCIIVFLVTLSLAKVTQANTAIENLEPLLKDQWLALLHYHDGHSLITDRNYFVSNTGGIDPYSELNAILEIYRNGVDKEVYCKFPYRFK